MTRRLPGGHRVRTRIRRVAAGALRRLRTYLELATAPGGAATPSPAERVSQRWAEAADWHGGEILHWLQHPLVQRRLNVLVSGDPTRDRFQYFLDTYLAGRLPVRRALTLGCGHGDLERGLARYGFALAHDAVDLSPGAVERAARAAREAGLDHVSYSVADLNEVVLPERAYDVVFGVSAVHHVERLEHLFEQVARTLVPEGYFFLDEFVGPSQFQWTPAQLRAVNEVLASLPPALLRTPSGVKGPVERPSLEAMNQGDPSEAVRSAEILPLLRRWFEVLEVRGYGGTLLHLALEGIAGNFPEADPVARAHLEAMFRIEDRLIASGVLSHDFVVAIARPRA